VPARGCQSICTGGARAARAATRRGARTRVPAGCVAAGDTVGDHQEEIGNEVHEPVDQFFRIEEGRARFVLGRKEEHLVGAGGAVVVPAGTYHNVVNSSPTKPLKLYTVYSPPQHPAGTVHRPRRRNTTDRRARRRGRAGLAFAIDGPAPIVRPVPRGRLTAGRAIRTKILVM
jgi:mannose-6-phosphate isomerase-like protein (cupin superfamily)